MATYEEIAKANQEIKPITLERKTKDGKTVKNKYSEVSERVLAFRKVYPGGTIETSIVKDEPGLIVVKAIVKDGDRILSTGIAYEKENSSYINKTSYIENCETGAIGRALGFAGFGIGSGIASADEIKSVDAQKEYKPTDDEKLKRAYPNRADMIKKIQDEKSEKWINNVLEHYGVSMLGELENVQLTVVYNKAYPKVEE